MCHIYPGRKEELAVSEKWGIYSWAPDFYWECVACVIFKGEQKWPISAFGFYLFNIYF